jgi:hypothetical protein
MRIKHHVTRRSYVITKKFETLGGVEKEVEIILLKLDKR